LFATCYTRGNLPSDIRKLPIAEGFPQGECRRRFSHFWDDGEVSLDASDADFALLVRHQWGSELVAHGPKTSKTQEIAIF
jgi:hypothetical protein